MTPESHVHPHDDLAVYALDALEPDEHAAVDAHLAHCADCRRELDAYLATLGQMAVPEEPPARVWEGISRQIRTPVIQMESRRRTPRWLLAAAAVVVVLGVGAVALTMGGGDSESVSDLAAAAARDPDSTVADLSLARVVVTDGDDYVLFDDLPALSSDETYQLWRTDEGEPVSLGVLGDGGEGAVQLDLPQGVASFAVSQEPAGGSDTPTDILATGLT